MVVTRLFAVFLVIVVADAATWMGRLPMKPKELAHKKGCYVQEIDNVIPFGVTISPIGYCYRIECTETMMYYASCGVVGTSDPKCYKTETDLSRPYPECCPTIECEQDNYLI